VQLVASMSRPIPFAGQALEIGASAGVSLYPVDGNDPDTLLTAADHRMYGEKSFRHYAGAAETSRVPAKAPQMVT
jgi:GGDEF domain-containing protein